METIPVLFLLFLFFFSGSMDPCSYASPLHRISKRKYAEDGDMPDQIGTPSAFRKICVDRRLCD
jgi:hypothetical protein